MTHTTPITVNASRCGAGKTTQDIYPRIRQLLRKGQQVIAVVPSIKLAYDYLAAIPGSQAITSQTGDSVNERLSLALLHRQSCIVITHAAFLQHVWSRLDRNDYHLVIDEVFDPFRFVRYKVDRCSEIENQFCLEEKILKGSWFPVTSPVYRDHTAYRESASYRELVNPNWSLWQSRRNNAQLHAGEWSEFGLELRRDSVFDHWASIHIAAARFDVSFLAAWLRKEQAEWTTTAVFEPHTNADIEWHSVDFNWSRTLRKQQPNLHRQYHDYVNQHKGSAQIIAIRNSDVKNQQLNNEVTVGHNCHGLNDYRDIHHVSIESSLNMHPEQQEWVADLLEMDPKTSSQQIKAARTTYTLYQVIMRCAMRNREKLLEPVYVYSCDRTVTGQLQDYFDGRIMTLNEIPTEHQARPPALTNAERIRAMRLKRKHPELAHLDARAILDWFTNSGSSR